MDTADSDVFILDAVRTPLGRCAVDGPLREVTAVALLSGLLRALADRSPALDTAWIDDAILGNPPLGEKGCLHDHVVRDAVLSAGWGAHIPGLSISRGSASGLDAIHIAMQRIRCKDSALMIAGGFSQPSREALPASYFDPSAFFSTRRIPAIASADVWAQLRGVTRSAANRFSERSRHALRHACASGRFSDFVVPVVDRNGLLISSTDSALHLSDALPCVLTEDEADAYDAVARMTYPELGIIDRVHAGDNTAPLVDGACLLLLGNRALARRMARVPRARIVAGHTQGGEPVASFGAAQAAAFAALAKAGWTISDVDLFEIHENYAVAPIAFAADLDIPLDKINVNGGAIGFGEAPGATGAILAANLMIELENRQLRRGLLVIAADGGVGAALAIERCQA